MTRRDFTRLRKLALLGVLPIVALASVLLYFALAERWAQMRSLPVAMQLTVTPAPTLTAMPTSAPTPTSIWNGMRSRPTQIVPATPKPETTTTISVGNVDSTAYVRFVHAAADAQAMDVYVNGAKTYDAQGYTSVSPYVGFPEGTYTVYGTMHGEATMLWRQVIQLQAGRDYSLVVLQAMHTDLLPDDNTLPEYGQVRLRSVNVSAQQPRTALLQLDAKWRSLLIDAGSAVHAAGYMTLPDEGVAVYLLGATRKRLLKAPQWQMGTVYTVWIFSAGNASNVGMSEDAFQFYPLLPETGGP